MNGEWTAPATVFSDGWHIPGCPTNGPAVAARGEEHRTLQGELAWLMREWERAAEAAS